MARTIQHIISHAAQVSKRQAHEWHQERIKRHQSTAVAERSFDIVPF